MNIAIKTPLRLYVKLYYTHSSKHSLWDILRDLPLSLFLSTFTLHAEFVRIALLELSHNEIKLRLLMLDPLTFWPFAVSFLSPTRIRTVNETSESLICEFTAWLKCCIKLMRQVVLMLVNMKLDEKTRNFSVSVLLSSLYVEYIK